MKFALAGNPNSGKTTLFNNLTGSSAHVGNWPGVTVDRKEGVYRGMGGPVTIVDLPGVYSLSPYSPEEVVSRDFIVEQNPDLIINIVDVTNLERNLYLTTQLMETDCPLVVALNMMDLLEKEGGAIDTSALEKELGVPVVPISAQDASGLEELMKRALASTGKREGTSVLSGTEVGEVVRQTVAHLKEHEVHHPVFHAVKLTEGDDLENREFLAHYDIHLLTQIDALKKTVVLTEEVGRDFEAAVADLRYRYITSRCGKILRRAHSDGKLSPSDRIDRLLTHKYLGIPVFLAVMFFVFHLTFSENLFFATELPSPGVWLQSQMGHLVDFLAGGMEELLSLANASAWAQGLLVNGLIAGVGAVLSFLPQIMMLFLFLSILEDSGYMARAAFLMDRILRHFGLSGKAFLPMLMGFGCSVPAMMATRTLEDERDRRITIMLMPCFSCGAKAPIWAMFAAALFPQNGDVMIFGIYLIGILAAVGAGILLKKLVFRKNAVPFIMELPPYRMPRPKNIVIELWEKLRGFLLRASTLIAGATVVIWFLSNFGFSLQMVEENSADSILGILGRGLVPIFQPLGFADGPDGWKGAVAVLTGLIAKEMVVSTMGVLYAPAGEALAGDVTGTALAATLASTFSPLAALSFMAFNLLCVPCVAAVATAHSEMKNRRWTFYTLCFWIALAWSVSFLIFRIGRLMGF